jgi:hypothetical protein
MQCKVVWYSVKCPDIPEELIASIIRADDSFIPLAFAGM